MRILITGHRGYIGWHLMKSYEDIPGVDVQGLERSDRLMLDIENSLHDFEPDVVVHCGAIRDSMYANTDIFIYNTQFTNRLAFRCMELGVHFVFTSSCLSENPSSLYAWSKRLSEDFIKALNWRDYCILQLFNVWGLERRVPFDKRSVPTQILEKRLPWIFDIKRDYIHVTDVVRALRVAIDTKGDYQVGTGEILTPKMLCDDVGHQATLRDAKAVLGMEIPRSLRAETESPCILPGWKPRPFAERWEEEKCRLVS